MQLWCPEARTVVVDVGGPKVATMEFQGMGANQVEASPALNRMDMGGLKIPQSCLCFGSQCGAWQWSPAVRGRDGKTYASIDLLRAKPDAMPAQQLGYCGKAAPLELVEPIKRAAPTPAPANDDEQSASTTH